MAVAKEGLVGMEEEASCEPSCDACQKKGKTDVDRTRIGLAGVFCACLKLTQTFRGTREHCRSRPFAHTPLDIKRRKARSLCLGCSCSIQIPILIRIQLLQASLRTIHLSRVVADSWTRPWNVRAASNNDKARRVVNATRFTTRNACELVV